jgi:DNA-binding NarL/FixJ family response regulator
VGVVVLSQYSDPSYLVALISEGSAGRAYLLKERIATPGELAGAIRAVATGSSRIDPTVVEAMVAAGVRTNSSPLRRLTQREQEILSLLASGRSNAGIARVLFVSDRAVEKHINSIFAKLDLLEDRSSNRRVKAVLMFLDAASA